MSTLLSIKHLSKSFAQEQVLRDINADVYSGDIKVLIGKSGCGKSTLLKCINQLETPDAGSIQVNHDYFDFNRKKHGDKNSIKRLRQTVGIVFQQPCLWPHLSVLKNLTLASIKLELLSKSDAKQKALLLLERFKLSHKVKSSPNTLSGGQQQRISIARSLMLNPKLMLFDEPTASLDPEMTQEVLSIIKELKKDNMAMLISTHEIGFAKSIADEIFFLHKGKLFETGNSNIIDTPKTPELKHFLQHTYH